MFVTANLFQKCLLKLNATKTGEENRKDGIKHVSDLHRGHYVLLSERQKEQL